MQSFISFLLNSINEIIKPLLKFQIKILKSKFKYGRSFFTLLI
jgi:hypothetical protein